jgi:hypothetical protein
VNSSLRPGGGERVPENSVGSWPTGLRHPGGRLNKAE